MEAVHVILATIRQFLQSPVFKLGTAPVTLWNLLQLVVLVAQPFPQRDIHLLQGEGTLRSKVADLAPMTG